MDWNYEEACRQDARKVGYTVSRTSESVVAEGVPYRKADRQIGHCRVIVLAEPSSDKPRLGYAGVPHTARVEGVEDGVVYNMDGTEIGNQVGKGSDWCILSIKKGTTESPGEYEDVWEQLLRYVYVISEGGAAERAKMEEWRAKLEKEVVGIVGLGGTGSYILDLVSKTGIERIIVWDGDSLEERNMRRGVGPEKRLHEKLGQNKAQVLGEEYTDQKCEIEFHPHNFTEEDKGTLQKASFLFIAVDRQESREVVQMVAEQIGMAYIDVGLGLRVEEGVVTGGCQVVLSNGEGGRERELINVGGVAGGEQAYRMVLVSEMHALNAALAVIKWRRFRGQYRQTTHVLSRYDADWNLLHTES